ncbi:HlyD family secretion protein [Enhydrobacter aerosaccus]|uniref:HlyD family secretion protein n=1 Tax=Enhydrobacter aerosaccus TaxID=225324 RepID=A0A1T4S9Y1_9HYPH|nr:efflux RND transporter periplasmic adaptor subunit [Enhydrobacter aerosaccus]SKA25120.1 HlyD family secretion protein [Enhydrobacter aerosaccus]
MNKRLLSYLSVAIVLAASAASVGLFLHMRPVSVTVVAPEQHVPVRVFGLGTVEARIVSKIGFEIGAAIVELRADHGDIVKKGDVLARLHASAQEAKVVRAKAIVLSAEAGLTKVDANIAKARAVFAQKQATNRRVQQLADRKVVSEQTAEETQRDEGVAKADLTVALAEAEVANAFLADARAQLQVEEALLAQYVLIAPFDAMVVERHKELGTVIKPGDPIFTLVAPETVWGLAYIDEARAGPIAEGQPAIVRLRSLPQQRFEAKVVRIGIESDRVNEERRVYVKCGQCPPQFHLGEQAEVLITVANLDHALLVPEAAVRGFDGTTGTVWTVENGLLERRVLIFRYRTEDARLEVVGGLPDHAKIVAAPGAGFRGGRAARVIAETGK